MTPFVWFTVNGFAMGNGKSVKEKTTEAKSNCSHKRLLTRPRSYVKLTFSFPGNK